MPVLPVYRPSRPQLAGEVLDSGFRIFQRTLRASLPYGLLCMIAAQLANLYDLIAGKPLRLTAVDPVGTACVLAGALLGLTLGGALLLRQNALTCGAPASAARELRAAVRRLPALAAVALGWLALLALLAAVLAWPGLGLWALLSVPAAVYATLVCALAPPLVLIEGLGPLAALAASMRLLRGRAARTLLVGLVSGVLLLAGYALCIALAAFACSLAGIDDVALVGAVSAVTALGLVMLAVPFASAMSLAVSGELVLRAAAEPPRVAVPGAASPRVAPPATPRAPGAAVGVLALTAALFAAAQPGRATATVAPATAATASSSNPAAAATLACIERLDREIDVGYARVAARCPQLAPQLARGGLARWMPHGWRDPDNDLSAGGLSELAVLIQRELAPPNARARPALSAVPAALAGLAPPAAAGRWDRFRGWLRELAHAGAPAAPGSVGRALRGLPAGERWLEAFTVIAWGAILAIALGIAARELSAWRREPAVADAHAPPGVAGGALARETDEEGGATTCAGLLARVLARLTRIRSLTGSTALTTRELTSRIDWPDPSDAPRFALLARTAEQVRFAAAPPPAPQLASALSAGAVLIERLDRGACGEIPRS